MIGLQNCLEAIDEIFDLTLKNRKTNCMLSFLSGIVCCDTGILYICGKIPYFFGYKTEFCPSKTIPKI